MSLLKSVQQERVILDFVSMQMIFAGDMVKLRGDKVMPQFNVLFHEKDRPLKTQSIAVGIDRSLFHPDQSHKLHNEKLPAIIAEYVKYGYVPLVAALINVSEVYKGVTVVPNVVMRGEQMVDVIRIIVERFDTNKCNAYIKALNELDKPWKQLDMPNHTSYYQPKN